MSRLNETKHAYAIQTQTTVQNIEDIYETCKRIGQKAKLKQQHLLEKIKPYQTKTEKIIADILYIENTIAETEEVTGEHATTEELEEITKDRDNLKKEAQRLQEQLDALNMVRKDMTDEIEQCDTSFRRASLAAFELLKQAQDVLTKNYTDILGDMPQTGPIIITDKQRAAAKAAAVDRMVKRGVLMLVRVKCYPIQKQMDQDEIDIYENKETERTILSYNGINLTASQLFPTFEIYDDVNSENCKAQRDLLVDYNEKRAEIMSQMTKEQKENAPIGRIDEFFKPKYAQLEDTIEASRSNPLPKQMDQEFLTLLKDANLPTPLPGSVPFKERKDERIFNIIQAEYDKLYSYGQTIASGFDFVHQSPLSFLKRQDPLLGQITIVGMGTSGSGKTTSSRAIVNNILDMYGSSFPTLIRASIITAAFYEVFQEFAVGGSSIKVRNLPTTPLETNLKFPYLKTWQAAEGIDSKSFVPIQNNLCGTDDTRPCDDLTMELQSQRIQLMKKLRILDTNSEQHRQTRYTANNPNGSSRSIKVVTITISNQVQNQQVKINVIDTAGYEEYKITDLQVFYKNFIVNALSGDRNAVQYGIPLEMKSRRPSEVSQPGFSQEAENIRKGLKSQVETKQIEGVVAFDPNSQSIVRAANTQAQNAIREGSFIRDSLNYVESAILGFQELKKLEQENPNATFSTKQLETKINQVYEGREKKKYPPQDPWITNLKLLTADSALVVLGTFKKYVNITEKDAVTKTVQFLHDVNIQMLKPAT